MIDSFVFINADILIDACELKIKDLILSREEKLNKYRKYIYEEKRKINKIANRYSILTKKYPLLKLFTKKIKRLSFEETVEKYKKNTYNFKYINDQYSGYIKAIILIIDMAKISKIKSNSKVLLSEEKFKKIQRYINYEDK